MNSAERDLFDEKLAEIKQLRAIKGHLAGMVAELEANYARLHDMFVKRGIELNEMEARLVDVVVSDWAEKEENDDGR